MAEPSPDMAVADSRPRIGRIDLVLVVACLGVLAAVALPRQRAVTAGTRRTETNALAASIRSAAELGHSLWRARGGPATLEVQRGAATVRVAMINGFPAPRDIALLLEEPETMAFTRDGASWRHRSLSEGQRCGVSYAPPQRVNQPPRIELEVSDC